MIDVLRRQIAYYIYKLGILKDNQYNKFKLVSGEISKVSQFSMLVQLIKLVDKVSILILFSTLQQDIK